MSFGHDSIKTQTLLLHRQNPSSLLLVGLSVSRKIFDDGLDFCNISSGGLAFLVETSPAVLHSDKP